jgi:hypothetical protein
MEYNTRVAQVFTVSDAEEAFGSEHVVILSNSQDMDAVIESVGLPEGITRDQVEAVLTVVDDSDYFLVAVTVETWYKENALFEQVPLN